MNSQKQWAVLILCAATTVWAQTDYNTHIAPWLHHNGVSEAGMPQGLDEVSWKSGSLTNLVALSLEFGSMQSNQLAEVDTFVATNSAGWTKVWSNEHINVRMVRVENGKPVYEGALNLEAAGAVGGDVAGWSGAADALST
tara:strand:- start:990 stop:1409 length:420 start_codon:yes stop_codon:yes gene_type:complete